MTALLLRIGLVARKRNGKIAWPFRVPPARPIPYCWQRRSLKPWTAMHGLKPYLPQPRSGALT